MKTKCDMAYTVFLATILALCLLATITSPIWIAYFLLTGTVTTLSSLVDVSFTITGG